MKKFWILIPILFMMWLASINTSVQALPPYPFPVWSDLTPFYLSTAAAVTVEGESGYYYNSDDDAIEFDLPADPTDKEFCFHTYIRAQVVTIDPNGTDVIILDGAAETGGEAIVSSGAAGEYICLHGINSTTWVNWFKGGTWDGAAD